MERPQQASCLATQPASRKSQEPKDPDSVDLHGVPGIRPVPPKPEKETTDDYHQNSSHSSPNSHMVWLNTPSTRSRRRKVVHHNNGRLVRRHLVLLKGNLDLVQGLLKIKGGGRLKGRNTRRSSWNTHRTDWNTRRDWPDVPPLEITGMYDGSRRMIAPGLVPHRVENTLFDSNPRNSRSPGSWRCRQLVEDGVCGRIKLVFDVHCVLEFRRCRVCGQEKTEVHR